MKKQEKSKKAYFKTARSKFHKNLIADVLTIDSKGIPSNADSSQNSSKKIAQSIAEQLNARIDEKSAGQTLGDQFEKHVEAFLQDTFLRLSHLRPGKFNIKQVSSRKAESIYKFSQYEHLSYLAKATKENPQLAASLGNDYTISPDIVITREREYDTWINRTDTLVDKPISVDSDIRKLKHESEILHASVSTKWTIRSDRAQNSRSEALNLIRNRKGKLPHIVVVTGEPSPSRLASLALGTGDIDCVYHFALYELIIAVKTLDNDEATQMLNIMIEGRRLKDISDLPLDLAV